MCNELEKKIVGYFKSKKEVIAVYLFGSYAVGKERPLSDIDIGILLDERYRDVAREKRNSYLTELSRILRKDIHPVILNSVSEELMAQIFKKGKCILINDSKKLSRYRMVMLSRMTGFEFYRNQMKKGMIRRIMKGWHIG